MVTIQVLLICCVPIQKPHMVGVMEVTSLHCPAKSGEISKFKGLYSNINIDILILDILPHAAYTSTCIHPKSFISLCSFHFLNALSSH